MNFLWMPYPTAPSVKHPFMGHDQPHPCLSVISKIFLLLEVVVFISPDPRAIVKKFLTRYGLGAKNVSYFKM